MNGAGDRVAAERWIRRVRVERDAQRHRDHDDSDPFIVFARVAVATVAGFSAAVFVGWKWDAGWMLPVGAATYCAILYAVGYRG